MSTPGTEVDAEWGKLLDLGDEERQAAMAKRYQELAALEEEKRRHKLMAMARAEYALSDEELRSFTASRLRTWLAMETQMAKRIASSYDSVMEKMPGGQAMRRVATVQTIHNQFSVDDRERLATMIPNIFIGAGIRAQVHKTQQPPRREAPARKGWRQWWPFGGR